MAVIEHLFTIVAPVVICAAIGWFWASRGGRFDVSQVTTLITSIGVPCLVFHTLSSLSISIDAAGAMVVGAILCLVLSGCLGWTVLTLAGLQRQSYLTALVFPNSGNIGLPLNMLAFGEVGLALAVAVFCANSLMHFTVGTAISSGATSIRVLARVPLLYAIPPALVFLLTDLEPPQWISATTEILGGMTIPLMLIALGVSLARLHVQSVPRSVGLALVRLIGGVAIGFAVAWLLGLEGTERGVLIIQSAMPSAVFNYLFALQYQNEPEQVAGIVVASTLMSFATLPLLLWLVL